MSSLTAFFRALYAEQLKLKRTLALRMVFVAPLLIGALNFFALYQRRNIGPDFKLWDTIFKTSLSVWAIFMMPLLITLETALLNGIDHNEKNWKHLFALPLPRHAVYLAKLIVAQALIALSTFVVAVLSIGTGFALMRLRPVFANAGAPSYGWLFKHAALVWLASWLIIAIHNWVSIRWASIPLALGTGIGGVFFALFATSAKLGKYYPWLLPINVLSDERITMAVWVGGLGGVIAAVLGCLEFVRRDVA